MLAILHTLQTLLLSGELLALSNGGVRVPEAVRASLVRAAAIPGARIEIGSYQGNESAGCRVESADVARAIDGSGRVAVKVAGKMPSGAGCGGWAWAGVRMFAQVPVTSRALRAGDVLAGATQVEEREIHAGRTPLAKIDGAVAGRAIRAGVAVEESAARGPSLRPGQPVRVVLAVGSLSIEQTGKAIGCTRGRACALLSSGKRIEGTLVDGRLVVTP